MRCPVCKQGHGSDRWSQESLDKHMASFHRMLPIAKSASSQEYIDQVVDQAFAAVAEAEAKEAEAIALDEALRKFEVQHVDAEAVAVLAIPTQAQEITEAQAAVRRLDLESDDQRTERRLSQVAGKPMSLSSKICWSWLATVLLVALTLIALVAITKV